MDSKLQLLIDHFEIREVIEAYVHAQDRADEKATADVYHPDSRDDHGPLKSDGFKFAADATNALLTNWSNCTHLLGQSRIKVTGDKAGAETYFHASLTREAEGKKMLDQMVGRYIDIFERRNGQWRIKDRRCISHWATTNPITADHLGHLSFLQSHRSEADPSYEVLDLKRGLSRITR